MNIKVNSAFEIIVEAVKVHADEPTERRNGTMMSDINFVVPIRNISSKTIEIKSNQFHVAFKDYNGKLFWVDTVRSFEDCQSKEDSSTNGGTTSDAISEALDSVFSTVKELALAFSDGMSEKIDQNENKYISFTITVDSIIYHQFSNLREICVSVNNTPPICLKCDENQSNWKYFDPNLNSNGIGSSDITRSSDADTPSQTSNRAQQKDIIEQDQRTNDGYQELNSLGEFKYICPHCGQHFDCPPECEGVACLCPTCNNTIYPERPQENKTNNSTLIISCDFLGSLEQASSNSTLLVNVPDTIILSDSDDDEEEYSEEEKELLEKAYNSALDQVNSVLNSLASALGGGSSEEEEDDVIDDDDEEEDDEFDEDDDAFDEIDWDGIDDDMQSDMEDALDSIVEDTVYDMPPEATEEFEQAAEEAWSQYRSSSSFRSEFRSWRDENGYDDDDMDFAEDSMKDEWIDEWKIDNEDDWNETWCEEHADELKDRWHKEKETEWKKEWARDNAEYHDVSAEQILFHWGMSDAEVLLEVKSNDSNNKNMEHSITNGETNMKNKIPVETHFKTVSGYITACMQDGILTLYCDLSYQDDGNICLSVSVYDEDGDICGSAKNRIYWFDSPYTVDDMANDAKPVRVVVREKN